MKKRSVHTGSPVPATLRGFQRKFPEVWKAYEGFREACDDQGPLDTKTRELIKVAISVALGREAWWRTGIAVGTLPWLGFRRLSPDSESFKSSRQGKWNERSPYDGSIQKGGQHE